MNKKTEDKAREAISRVYGALFEIIERKKIKDVDSVYNLLDKNILWQNWFQSKTGLPVKMLVSIREKVIMDDFLQIKIDVLTNI